LCENTFANYYVLQVFSSEERQLNQLSQFHCKFKKLFNKGFTFFERTIISDTWKDLLGFAGDAKAHRGSTEFTDEERDACTIRVQGTGRTTLPAMLCLYMPSACSSRAYLNCQNA